MPCLLITTNVAEEGLDVQKICKDANDLISGLLGFPPARCIVQVQFRTHYCYFNDTTGPVAMIQLYNIYPPDVDQAKLNAKISKAMSIFLEERFGVPKDRYLMGFLTTEYFQVGIEGSIAAWLPPVGSPPEEIHQDLPQERFGTSKL